MNKNKNNYSTFIVIFCLLFACTNKSEVEKTVKHWQGKHFFLPNDSLMIKTNRSTFTPLSKKIKIATTINASCGACITELEDWMVFMKGIDTSQVGFVFLLYSNDQLMAFEKINSASIHFTYPYFHDKGRKVFLKNDISESKLYQTFLLDSTNNVILVGNPINNKDLSAIYQSEIKKRISMPRQSSEIHGVKVVRKDNCTVFYIDEEVKWQDENGKMISITEAKKLTADYDCYVEQTSATLFTIRKRPKSK